MKKCMKIIFCMLPLFATSCAFDLVHVKQIPTKINCTKSKKPSFILHDNIKIGIGTGYSTTLYQDTKWEYVGTITEGDVYKTRDQIVTVEGSNIFEAYIVISNNRIVGFYLPVERSYCPIDEPINMKIQILKE